MANADDDDIDRWLATLAGRKPEGAPQDDDWEALALREAIRRDARRTDAAEDKEGDDHAWQRFAFRLRREGLEAMESDAGHAAAMRDGIELPREFGGSRRRFLQRRWVPFAAAAMLMLGIGIVGYQQAPTDSGYPVSGSEAPQYRSAFPTIEVGAVRPVPSARQLASAVQPLGVEPRIYAFDGQAVVDMDVPADKLDELRKQFEKNAIPAGALQAGLVRVIFKARSQSK